MSSLQRCLTVNLIAPFTVTAFVVREEASSVLLLSVQLRLMEDGTAEYNWLEAELVNHYSNSAATFPLRHQADEMMIGSPRLQLGSFVLFFTYTKNSKIGKPPGRSGNPHRYRSQGQGGGPSPSFLIVAMIRRHGWGSTWGFRARQAQPNIMTYPPVGEETLTVVAAPLSLKSNRKSFVVTIATKKRLHGNVISPQTPTLQINYNKVIIVGIYS